MLATAVVCPVCQRDNTPEHEETWRCAGCGQTFRGESILLSDRQAALLRQVAGRDPTGRSTLVRNWWTDNDMPTGEQFLTWNKTSAAREHCRNLIKLWAQQGWISSILEIAFGGLHEFRALRGQIGDVRYGGVDWTPRFVEAAQREFPDGAWQQGDIVRDVAAEPADLVYSQHMLEHVPSLEPAFSNMLRLSRKVLLNIFFIPPQQFDGREIVDWKQYPLYHNTYAIGHVEHVCRANGFEPEWMAVGNETILLARRPE